MTSVEEFLSTQKRYRCEKLSADLTLAQCEVNRTRVPAIFQCDTCLGLGRAVQMEESKTVFKWPADKLCSEPGCVAKKWRSGKCWKHEPENVKHKEQQAKKVVKESAGRKAAAVKSALKPVTAPAPEPVKVKVNPLLSAVENDQIASPRHLVLDFTDHADLWAHMRDGEPGSVIHPENIVELLDCILIRKSVKMRMSA